MTSADPTDHVYEIMVKTGAEVLDEPRDYGGKPGYGRHYYAVFFSDPDGFKIEVVHAEAFNG
jgi:glyoxylase I family protein